MVEKKGGRAQWEECRTVDDGEGGWWSGLIEICKAAATKSGVNHPKEKVVERGSQFAMIDFTP